MSLSVRLFGDRGRAQELVGEAKRRLALLKQSMGFQGLKQLSLPAISLFDGSTIMVKSIFGIDIIEVVGAGVVKVLEFEEVVGAPFLVFLIVSSTEYAIWKIKDEGTRLTPYSFNIGAESTFFRDILNLKYPPVAKDSFLYPSTVKSNSDLTHHVVQIEERYNWISYPRYGVRYNIAGTDSDWIIHGNRNCYQPIGWSVDTKWGWDTDYAVWLAYWSYLVTSYPIYLCSGRQSWYVDEDGKVIKNLELWAINSNTAQIEYDTEDGHQIGPTFSFRAVPNYYQHSAVLSKDKIIGRDSTFINESGNTKGPTTGNCIICAGAGYSAYTYADYTYWNRTGYEHKFGDVVLETARRSGAGSNKQEWFRNFRCVPYTEFWTYGVYDYEQRTTWEGNEVKLIDYDNINIDETFIILYYTDTVYSHITNHVAYWGSGSGTIGFAYYYYGQRRQWKLAYRINGGDLHQVYLCNADHGRTQRETTGFTYDGSDCINGIYQTSYSDNTDFRGQRMVRGTCKANEKYLLYSYIIQNFTGPVEDVAHFDEYDDVNWTFNKRILGIIDIETGKRTEHEVNDALLGNVYKNSFDKTKASAIGLHKI